MASSIFSRLHTRCLTSTPEEMEAIGAELALRLPVDHVLALRGKLGTGKTTFVRGLARGLGIKTIPTSPSYNIFAIYKGDRQLIHMDAYRLEGSDAIDGLMLDSFLQSPWLIALEWPERLADWLEEESVTTLQFRILADGQHEIHLLDSNGLQESVIAPHP